MSDWLRSSYDIARDPRAIAAQGMPTIHLLATEAAAGMVRIGLHRDGATMVSLTIPGIPTFAEVVFDSLARRVTGISEGVSQVLPLGFVTGNLYELFDLDISRGSWTLTVDQVPGAAVAIDVRVVTTPVGVS